MVVYMQYPGVALDKDGRAFECPVCRNTDLHDHGSYCIICGTRIDNLCLSAKNLSIKDMRQKNASEKESFNDIHSEGCGSNKPLPGNARYCPTCGERTIFFYKGYLRQWRQYLGNLLRIDDCKKSS